MVPLSVCSLSLCSLRPGRGLRASSARRAEPKGCRRGLSGARRGRCRSIGRAVDGEHELELDPAAAGVVGVDRSDRPADLHRLAGEHGAAHREAQAPEPSGRPRPVGDEPLEEAGLRGGVQEDVPHAVALDRELVVVVHRPPVAAAEGAEHDRRRGDVVREARHLVAHVDVADQHVMRGRGHVVGSCFWSGLR